MPMIPPPGARRLRCEAGVWDLALTVFSRWRRQAGVWSLNPTDLPSRAHDHDLREPLGPDLYPQTSLATWTTRASLAFCSSAVSTLPSTVDEKPHCGDRQS